MGASYKYLDLLLALRDDEIHSPATIAAFGVEHDLACGEPKARVQNTLVCFSRKLKARWPELEKDGQTRIGTAGFYGVRWKASLPENVLGEDRYEKIQQRLKNVLDRAAGESPPELKEPEAAEQRTVVMGGWLPIAAALLVFVIAMVPRFNTGDPLQQIMKLQRQGKVDELRALLPRRDYQPLRSVITDAIARVHYKDEKQPLMVRSIDSVQAVFAFEHRPMVIFEDQVLQPGELLAVGGHSGYISEIRATRLVLETDEGPIAFMLPKVTLFGYDNWRSFPVSIFGERDNLETLLRAICTLTDRELKIQDGFAGSVVGNFKVTDYDSFLGQIADYVAISYNETQVESLVTREPRGYVGFTESFNVIHTDTLSGLLEDFGEHLGYEIVLLDEDRRVMFAPAQLSELCRDLNLKMQVNHLQRYAEISSGW